MSRAVQWLWVVCVLLPGVASSSQNEPLRVYAGIAPIQYLVDRVVGDAASARALVRAGQRPETYEPTPKQTVALARAEVFFGVGLPLESVWHRQLRAAGQGPQWVDLSQGLEEAGNHAHNQDATAARPAAAEHDHHHHHDGRDPHIWLNPLAVQRMVATIGEVLGRTRPTAADRYTANAEKLNRELEALHAEIQAIFEQSPIEAFLVFHPAWGHFAELYGLEQLAIETEGKEPGPRALAQVIDKAKRAGVRTVFLEPRHDTRLAKTVAKAIGGKLGTLDPLAYDYMQNMRDAARAIAESGP